MPMSSPRLSVRPRATNVKKDPHKTGYNIHALLHGLFHQFVHHDLVTKRLADKSNNSMQQNPS